jgi:type II secretory pathway predicted ATPase ExeA
MYLEHFGLTLNPFGISPRLDFLYKSGAFEESMAHLVFGLDNSEAIVMITGAIGTGKTMAIQSFLSHLGDRYLSALITNTCVDGRELLKLILDDLGVPVEARADKSDLLIAFKKFLIAEGKEGRRFVIVVDEAQHLSREVLEEIRQLTNLGQGEEQPVQIILVGQPELEVNIARPDLAQLKQRIRVHYKLAPLTRREMEEYVDHRMVVAGGRAGTFSARALDRIYQMSGGVPRVVNALGVEALLAAFVAGRNKVEATDLDDQASAGAELSSPLAPTAAAAEPAPKPATEARVLPVPDPERVTTSARSGSSARSDMAVRREVATASPPRANGKASARAPKKVVRGRNLAIAATVIAGVVVVLAATGRLDSVRWRSPAAGASDGTLPSRATIGTPPSPVEAKEVGLSASVVDSTALLKPATADTTMVASQLIQAAAVPVIEERPRSDSDIKTESVVRETAASSVALAADGEHFIHVSSFRTEAQAADVAAQFTKRGSFATVKQQTVRESIWYRVYLGPFGSHDDAVRFANRLRAEGTITYFKVVPRGTEDGL